MITVIFTDGDLKPIGQPIVKWKRLQSTISFRARASTTLTLPALGKFIEMAQPGNRLVVIRDRKIFVGGPIEYPAIFSRSSDPTSDSATPGLLTVASTDDSVCLDRRLCYPDPTKAATAQTTDWYTRTAQNAEAAMRELVNDNAGPGALTARQVPHLALGSLATVGTNVNVRTRFDVLSAQLDAIALAGGDLGYNVVQDGTDLKFVVYQPVDLSAAVRFSWSLRNLREVSYQFAGPTATVAIVGGDGTGSSRTIVERSNAAAITAGWGRIEAWVNDSSADTTDLNQSGDDALTSAAEQAYVTSQVIDVPSRRYGVHYNLGDTVSIEPYPGVTVTDVIRAVTLTSDATGEVVMPQIGTQTATSDPTTVRMLRDQDRRIGALERT